MTLSPFRVLWICPDEPGFRQYSKDLVAAMNALPAGDESGDSGANDAGRSVSVQLEIIPRDWSGHRARTRLLEIVAAIRAFAPDVVHLQHEYGLFGSKVPGRYRFPALVRKLRELFPNVKLVATAHMVIDPDYRYDTRGRGWQVPLRWIANGALLPFARRVWNRGTWAPLDGVIVHSAVQIPILEGYGARAVYDVPQYVPERFDEFAENPREASWKGMFSKWVHECRAIVFVFGYISEEKGQDVVIEALARARSPCSLVLAGGTGGPKNHAFILRCRERIEVLGLRDRVLMTGFVSFADLDYIAARAGFAILPFRFTANSGSLADLIARKVPLLASDLALNRDINDRVAGCLELFRSEDPSHLGRRLDEMLAVPARTLRSRVAGPHAEYARKFSAAEMARRQRDYYLREFA